MPFLFLSLSVYGGLCFPPICEEEEVLRFPASNVSLPPIPLHPMQQQAHANEQFSRKEEQQFFPGKREEECLPLKTDTQAQETLLQLPLPSNSTKQALHEAKSLEESAAEEGLALDGNGSRSHTQTLVLTVLSIFSLSRTVRLKRRRKEKKS